MLSEISLSVIFHGIPPLKNDSVEFDEFQVFHDPFKPSACDFYGMVANMSNRLLHKKTFLQKKRVYLQTKRNKPIKPIEHEIKINSDLFLT